MPLYCSFTWSKAVPWSVMRRVKMSSRPVELFGLPIAEVRWRRSSPSSSGMMYTHPFSSTPPAVMSISCIANSSSLALTVPLPGRKLARTR